VALGDVGAWRTLKIAISRAAMSAAQGDTQRRQGQQWSCASLWWAAAWDVPEASLA